MATRSVPFYTPDEYLVRERAADYKSEYVNGQIYAMADASVNHNRVAINIAGELRARLKGTPCQAFGGDMRLQVTHSGMYTYPDVMVVCGEVRVADEYRDNLLNPTLIVEVLSESTEVYDRDEKFAHYKLIESLEQYVLVSQDRPRIEVFTRQSENLWLYADSAGMNATANLDSIRCSLPLIEVYDRVEFAPDAAIRAPAEG